MFSSAETKVVTASASGVARLWRIHHGALEWELYGHDDAYMRCATLSPDPRFMATASALRQLELVFKGHDGWVNTAVFSPDCTQILTAAAARLWCTSTGKLIHTFTGHPITKKHLRHCRCFCSLDPEHCEHMQQILPALDLDLVAPQPKCNSLGRSLELLQMLSQHVDQSRMSMWRFLSRMERIRAGWRLLLWRVLGSVES